MTKRIRKTPKMNKRVKKLWLEALRSGEYLQTKETLWKKDPNGNDSFCCLGVLTNLYVEETGDLSAWDETTVLSEACVNWAGIIDQKFRLRQQEVVLPKPVRGMRLLTDLNDKGMSFSEIADVIEDQL